MAVPGQRTAAPFQIDRGEVVEHQGAVSEMSLGQASLNGLLAFQEPVHGRIQMVLVGLSKLQGLRQRVPCGVLGQGSGRGQLRHRPQDSGRNQRHHPLALRAGSGRKDALQAQLAHGAEHRGDMTVGLGADDVEGVLGADQGVALEQSAQGFDFGTGPVGEVGEGTFADALAFAPAFAEQDGGRGVPVGDDFHIHGNVDSTAVVIMQAILQLLHGNVLWYQIRPFSIKSKYLIQN